MLYFRKQNFLSNGPNILGLILFVAGIGAFGSLFFVEGSAFSKTIWIGIGACLIGFILMTISSGIAIDPTTSRYRHYDSILGFTSGEWHLLPKIHKIEIVQHAYTSQNKPNGITPTFTSRHLIHKVVFISSKKVELTIDFTQEKAAITAMEKIQGLIK